jgi:hypothetical protein
MDISGRVWRDRITLTPDGPASPSRAADADQRMGVMKSIFKRFIE